MFSLVRPPVILRKFYKDFTWSLPAINNEIYLTFDDGPVPGPTEFVLDQLKLFNAKATFFCVGKNVQENPQLYKRIIAEGHKTGNHTFNHVNGWKTDTEAYLDDIEKAAQQIQSTLFRPPYGKIKTQQSKFLLRDYKIIMWDVLSYDFSKNTTPRQCLKNVIRNVRPGSIIVFHDSVKAFRNLNYVLPECLEYLAKNEFKFSAIQ